MCWIELKLNLIQNWIHGWIERIRQCHLTQKATKMQYVMNLYAAGKLKPAYLRFIRVNKTVIAALTKVEATSLYNGTKQRQDLTLKTYLFPCCWMWGGEKRRASHQLKLLSVPNSISEPWAIAIRERFGGFLPLYVLFDHF